MAIWHKAVNIKCNIYEYHFPNFISSELHGEEFLFQAIRESLSLDRGSSDLFTANDITEDLCVWFLKMDGF